VIYVVLVAHWVGDFLLQDSRLALNKYRDRWCLLEHCVTYASTMGVASSFILPPERAVVFALVNAAAHLVIDAVTSRWTHKTWGWAEHPRVFWNVIGFDQLLHVTLLALTLKAVTAW
jgi:hypothetical protein